MTPEEMRPKEATETNRTAAYPSGQVIKGWQLQNMAWGEEVYLGQTLFFVETENEVFVSPKLVKIHAFALNEWVMKVCLKLPDGRYRTAQPDDVYVLPNHINWIFLSSANRVLIAIWAVLFLISCALLAMPVP